MYILIWFHYWKANQMLENLYRSVLPTPSCSLSIDPSSKDSISSHAIRQCPCHLPQHWYYHFYQYHEHCHFSYAIETCSYIQAVNAMLCQSAYQKLDDIELIWLGEENFHKVNLNRKMRRNMRAKKACAGRDSRRPRFWALYSRRLALSIVYLCAHKG